MQREHLKEKLQITESFDLKEGVFAGQKAFLICPEKVGVDWSNTTPLNRSRIVDETGLVLSQSFPKFWNYGESPELYPNPLEFNDWEIFEKIDGSTCVLDFVNNQHTMRTRGAFDYTFQKNAADFELLYIKYPKLKTMVERYYGFTVLLEIITPNNKIILSYPEVDFILIGMINKKTGISAINDRLDDLASSYDLKRPKKYDLKNIDDLKNMVDSWRSQEGVVVTYNNGQSKIKIKAPRYCFLHRVITGLRSKKTIVDKFIELNCPAKEEFTAYFTKEFDFEIAQELEPEINCICFDYKTIETQTANVEVFADKLKSFDKKERAEQIIHKYSDWRKSYAFSYLDGKPLDNTILKRLLNN